MSRPEFEQAAKRLNEQILFMSTSIGYNQIGYEHVIRMVQDVINEALRQGDSLPVLTYIAMNEGDWAKSVSFGQDQLIVDLDVDGNVLGIELLGPGEVFQGEEGTYDL